MAPPMGPLQRPPLRLSRDILPLWPHNPFRPPPEWIAVRVWDYCRIKIRRAAIPYMAAETVMFVVHSHVSFIIHFSTPLFVGIIANLIISIAY